MPELALGTAQFGLNYGITNAIGQVSTSLVRDLLIKADNSGVVFVDTAQSYGNAIDVLGNALPLHNSFRIISKLPAQPVDQPFNDSSEAVWQRSLDTTLSTLKTPQLDTLLLHSSRDLKRPDSYRLLNWLLTVRERGQVRRIGVSIYQNEELDYLPLDHMQVVQLPCSLYDQRLIDNGTVKALRDLGIAIHARSLYLQGLLVTNPQHWPESISPALRKHHEKLHAWAQGNGWTLVQLALGWARRQAWMEAAVIGLTSVVELMELQQAWNGSDPWEVHHPQDWSWSCGRDLDPRHWL